MGATPGRDALTVLGVCSRCTMGNVGRRLHWTWVTLYFLRVMIAACSRVYLMYVFFILSTSVRNICILLKHAWSIVNLMSSDESNNKRQVYFILFMSTFSLMFISKFGQQNVLRQGSSTRGPLAACDPGRVFHKIQCVMNIETWVTRHYLTKGK